VGGDGRFFGFIETAADDTTKNGSFVENRTLEMLELATDGSVIYYGTAELPPNRFFMSSSTPDFAVHRAGEARFDASGNLYDLEWTPTQVNIIEFPAAP
jgi:hypothetical protein